MWELCGVTDLVELEVEYVLAITAIPTLEISKYLSKVRLNLIQQNMLCSTTKNVKKRENKDKWIKILFEQKKFSVTLNFRTFQESSACIWDSLSNQNHWM